MGIGSRDEGHTPMVQICYPCDGWQHPLKAYAVSLWVRWDWELWVLCDPLALTEGPQLSGQMERLKLGSSGPGSHPLIGLLSCCWFFFSFVLGNAHRASFPCQSLPQLSGLGDQGFTDGHCEETSHKLTLANPPFTQLVGNNS